MIMEEFHGPHLKPLRKGYTAIDWSDSVARSNFVRVRSHTCECLITVYEFCVAGGLGHIRRTERSSEGIRLSESPWLRVADAKRLWERLLQGHAQ
ncbi:hypothetical protein [Nonomuraea sp. NPDC048901]|uniref:hypothetical protein n=1 Tax=Nonomuraea sp. NPDC048901 TaxID=3155627 RepID=UPI0033F02BF6